MKKMMALFLTAAIAMSKTNTIIAEERMEEPAIKESYTIIDWNETYDSFDNMLSNSDVYIVGTVAFQETEERHNLYFTRSYVETDNDVVYEVLQIGAIIDNNAVNMPIDTMLLEIGNTYFLCLNEAEKSDAYEPYYLISGGNQGYGLYESKNNMVWAVQNNDRNVFESIKLTVSSKEILSMDVDDARLNFEMDEIQRSVNYASPGDIIWNKNPKFFIRSDISQNYGSTIKTQIQNGIKSWNGISSNISLSSTTSQNSADITVYMYDYGDIGGVAGVTNITTSSQEYKGYDVAENVDINLNTHGLNTSGSDLFWQAIACHEAGHAVGLSHTNEKTQSIMSISGYSYYFWQNGWSKPQNTDKTNLKNKYDRTI